MQAALRVFALWDNPVFHRFRRSQLRFKTSLFWLLATLIITSFVVSLPYIVQTNRGITEEQAARELWLPLLIIQGIILLIKGTGKTSAGLIQDKIEQTLDYQRLTPVKPLRNIVGYLFGLPLLEYSMFALTLPHLAFVVIKGNIPIGTVLSVYLVFLTCTIFYHTTAIGIAMVMKRWVWGYLLSIFSVAILNLVLAPLGSQLGLKFLQYLSVYPIIGQKVLPLTIPTRLAAVGGASLFAPAAPPPLPVGEAGLISFADPVPFFNWTLSPFLFTLLLQSGLIVTFATMAVRRWQKASKHSLGKIYALGMLAVFATLFIGNLWPVITGDRLPFQIFGQRDLESIREPVAVALPLVYAVASWLLCIFLFANVVPTHSAYIRGVRRAVKLGRKSARPWDDDAANIPFMFLFVVIALAGFWITTSQMNDAGFLDVLSDSQYYSVWQLPLVLGLTLFYSLLLLQVIEYRGAILCALLIWLLPILVAIVLSASMEEVNRLHTVLASVSPLATILMSGVLPLEAFVPVDQNDGFAPILTGAHTGLAFLGLQIVLLTLRWMQLQKTLR